VLDAVRYHSVGYAGWDDTGRVLYLADFLEPGRKRPPRDRDRLAADVPEHLQRVLRDVTRQRIEMTLAKGFPLLPETVAFWNSLL
jgi:HD superfamily phosphohydrolase YqeK